MARELHYPDSVQLVADQRDEPVPGDEPTHGGDVGIVADVAGQLVVGSTQTHPIALVAAPGVVVGDVGVEDVV
jgi:hypothetical protein